MTYLIYCAGAEGLRDVRRALSGRARRGGLGSVLQGLRGRPHLARSVRRGSWPPVRRDAQARYRCLAGRTKEACAVPPAIWIVPAVLAGVRVAVTRIAVRLRAPVFRVPLPVKTPVWTPASEGVKAPPVDNAPPHELAPPSEEPAGALAPEWDPPPRNAPPWMPLRLHSQQTPHLARRGRAPRKRPLRPTMRPPKTRDFACGRWSASDPPADSMEPRP